MKGAHMKRSFIGLVGVFAVILVSLFGTGMPADAQDDDPEATIEALQTTQIAELRDEVGDLRGQLPPTAMPEPERTGKDKYPYVGDPMDVFTRPFNYIGHNMSFCGTVQYIQVARPEDVFVVGDTKPRPFTTVAQIFLDGADAQFTLGFNEDSTGINEGSHACAWGTLFDTYTGTNTFGGSIINPLFDAEYFELG
jgi:hypothetical protein